VEAPVEVSELPESSESEEKFDIYNSDLVANLIKPFSPSFLIWTNKLELFLSSIPRVGC
jgi:hypothetical protein